MATTNTVQRGGAAARAAHAANASGHVRAPRRATGTDDGQERGVGTSSTTRPRPDHPTPQAAGTEYFSLDVEDVLAAGSRPDGAVCSVRTARPGTAAHRAADCRHRPLWRFLTILRRRWWNSCLTCSASFRALSPNPEQVIEVPTILPEDVSLGTAVREPQLVEQLVEVPTIVSWSMLQQIMEQNVDIPVVDRGCGGLSGFLPGQYSMTAEQIVDNPVPRRRFRGDLQGLHRGTEFNSVF